MNKIYSAHICLKNKKKKVREFFIMNIIEVYWYMNVYKKWYMKFILCETYLFK